MFDIFMFSTTKASFTAKNLNTFLFLTLIYSLLVLFSSFTHPLEAHIKPMTLNNTLGGEEHGGWEPTKGKQTLTVPR